MPQTKKNNKPKLSLQDILDQLPGHIYWKDKDGILLGCNSKTWQDFGSSSLKDYIGKTDYDLFPEAQADELVKTDREVIRTGKISIVEEFADLIDDSTALFLSHKAPLRDKAGETVGTIGVSLNVTKSKQEELERLNLLDNIIALMPEHVYWKDKKGKYLGCNDVQAHALKLKSRQEIVNKTPYENLSKKDAEMLQKIDAEVLEQGKVVTREEPGIREDGSEGVFLTKKVPLYDNEKNIAGLLGISFDITERKQTEKKLKKAMADAKVANRLKSEFIANMEHDIRTPCSGIAGTVNILEEKETDKTKKETLGYVKKAACNLLDLLNSIITFDLVESGRLPVIDKKFNIRSLIDSVVALETPTAKLKEVDLTTHCDDEIPKILIGDDYRLQRILINLVSNAIKFTKKGYVKIIVNIAQDYDDKTIILDITVKDTGIGIPKDKRQFIYEKFTKATPANQGTYAGTGLGLRIVKQFIEELEGEIEVQSEIEKGTTFICTLPFKRTLVRDKAVKPEKSAAKTTKARAKRVKTSEKILLVEDDRLAQLVAGSLLDEDMGYQVSIAEDGKEALELAKKNSYDLIFMDIGLPDTNGFEVTKAIRRWEHKNVMTPIVALTAHDIATAGAKAMAAGMNDFLVKPLNLEKAKKIFAKFFHKQAGAAFGAAESSTQVQTKAVGSKVIDLGSATKILGSMEAAKKMLSLLIEMLPEHQKEIERALNRKEYTDISGMAHKLVGASSYCGTLKLKAVAKELEAAARQTDIKKIKKLVEKLFAEMDAVGKAGQDLVS